MPPINALKSQRGQSMVLTLVFLTVLLGMAAAVIDVGAWYRAHRQTQSTADATALAGAQVLPHTANAKTLALDYAGRNGGGVNSADVAFTSAREANDTIKVTARKTVPGLFTKLMGISSVTARATAAARVGPMGTAKWAAPIGVDYRHDKLHCNVSLVCNPEFGVDTSLDLVKTGPGAFRLINIDGSHGGTGPGTLADWIQNGLNAYMPSNTWYYSDPGAKFNSSQVKSALDSRIGPGHELLFPIYNDTRGDGAGFDYHVVGWAGFLLTSYSISGSKNNKLFGQFVEIIWDGIQSESGGEADFGARSVELTQ
jgi:Putative Flp pilus-assembly TadE/G-like